jgi:DNA polymerase III alpha subunit
MEIISQILNNGTQLKDRFLVYDGDSILKPDKILEKILNGSKVNNICTSEITDDIKQFNLTSLIKIEVKTELKNFDHCWNIPKYYKNINVLEYVINKYINMYGKFDDIGKYNRIIHEMQLFKKYKLYDFLKTLIYINETFENQNIIKGVGRGSSVASYVLYIVGIHMIDSYKYNLEFSEFIREEELNNAKNS